MNDQNLNPQQKEAATHHGGPLLIIAGAGSGKTKTLTSRIAHLIATGTPPERILAVTFTNKAAAEMRERVERLLSAKRLAMSGLSVSTFHSWGARMLKVHVSLLGRTAAFSIFDEDDALRISKDVVKKMDLDTERYNPSVLRWKISKIKDELVDVGTLRGGDNHVDAPRAFGAVSGTLRARAGG
ncbi:MAG: UvrD-helicase domain-containing protein [Candidatus Harrisonbacteria bacterium]|nr:UvrD-helicase domain-containing protein [Candidatus Harrisonbacteria bacterium]